MRAVLTALLHSILSFLRSRQAIALEIVALRHQLAVLHRQTKRPRLTSSDRMLRVAMRRLWPKWERALLIVKPATVIAWQRAGFRAYWRRKSRPKGGRPKIDPEVRKLIRQMWRANPTWGRPRIQAELAKIGIRVSDSTVRKYKPKRRGPLVQLFEGKRSAESTRVQTALDGTTVEAEVRTEFARLAELLDKDDGEWLRRIPGKIVLQRFAAKASLDVTRLKRLYLRKASEVVPDPFAEVRAIFDAFAAFGAGN